MFSIKNVNFKNIIKYPNVDIPANKTTFICGESGCGKSTLLKLLCGVISADFGEITYNSKPLQDYDPIMLRREVLLCGQSAYLFDGSIANNFSQYYDYRDLQPIDAEKIKMFLNICAADFSQTAECSTMSGGEKQRIYTAICLSMNPKVLLMDEPTSALDDSTAALMLTNIKNYCRENKITLIIVSHSKALVNEYADFIVILRGHSHE